jgi:hypothetical protein
MQLLLLLLVFQLLLLLLWRSLLLSWTPVEGSKKRLAVHIPWW